MEKFHPKNRAIESVNRLFFIVLILMAFIIYGSLRVSKVKKNYTELHRRVSAIEQRLEAK